METCAYKLEKQIVRGIPIKRPYIDNARGQILGS